MTVAVGRLSQSRAGGSIRAGGQVRSASPDQTADVDWIGVGVTTANTLPGTFAGFAHFEGGAYSAAYWPTGTDTYSDTYAAGVVGAIRSVVSVFNKLIPLDSNFVAGRYVWLVVSETDPPISSTVPKAASASYLIR